MVKSSVSVCLKILGHLGHGSLRSLGQRQLDLSCLVRGRDKYHTVDHILHLDIDTITPSQARLLNINTMSFLTGKKQKNVSYARLNPLIIWM